MPPFIVIACLPTMSEDPKLLGQSKPFFLGGGGGWRCGGGGGGGWAPMVRGAKVDRGIT